MDAVLQQFDAINVWKQGEQRAPHKPLLILYALGKWQRGTREVDEYPSGSGAPGIPIDVGRRP